MVSDSTPSPWSKKKEQGTQSCACVHRVTIPAGIPRGWHAGVYVLQCSTPVTVLARCKGTEKHAAVKQQLAA
jgi:hypothetical protein